MNEIFYTSYKTPWGEGILSERYGRIQRILLPSQPLEHLTRELASDFPDERMRPGGEAAGLLAKALERYFVGENVDFPDLLDWSSYSSFQERVARAAMAIPFGQTRSYGWLGLQAGSPRAARACGQVMANNRFPVVVPCHRVLASNGGLGGFSCGLEWKERLLALEGRKQR